MRDAFAGRREIARLNIEHYGWLLQSDPAEQKRTSIERLLAAEKARLARLSQPPDIAPDIAKGATVHATR